MQYAEPTTQRKMSEQASRPGEATERKSYLYCIVQFLVRVLSVIYPSQSEMIKKKFVGLEANTDKISQGGYNWDGDHFNLYPDALSR